MRVGRERFVWVDKGARESVCGVRIGLKSVCGMRVGQERESLRGESGERDRVCWPVGYEWD